MHCPPAASALRGPVAALGVLAAVAVAVWAVAQVALFLAAAGAAVAVAAVPVAVVLRRSARLAVASGSTVAVLVRRGALPAPERARVAAVLVRAPYELPAPPLAIAAPVAAAVVPGARDGARVER